MDNLSIIQEFPSDFKFGVATSSYQIEGNKNGDCGLSIWDDFARKKLNGIDGKEACRHLDFFKEDIKLIKDAGFKSYRFSFSWPRLFPEKNQKLNNLGLDFYNRLLDEIHNQELEPYPTLYHWDLPIRFQAQGGWTNKDTAKYFSDFALCIAEHFSDRYNKIATINEPWCVSWLSHYLGEHAPGIKDLRSAAQAMHNILYAHGLAMTALKSISSSDVGIVLNNQYASPFNEDSKNIDAANLFDAIYNRWFSDAIFLGQYPEIALEILGKYLPPEFKEDLKIISTPIDWLGMNYYTRSIIKDHKSNDGINYKCIRGDLKKTDMDWEFYPQGLRYFIERIHYEYNKKIPIYITENGMANKDFLDKKNEITDEDRIEYFDLHLKEVLECIHKGIPVKGYFAWSLMDNYEWSFGYEKRFGLVYVDYQSFKRIPKKSYYEFQKNLCV